MTREPPHSPQDGDHCKVVGGTHAGKSGVVRDVHASKAGHLTLTVMQADSERFKTLVKNVAVQAAGAP